MRRRQDERARAVDRVNPRGENFDCLGPRRIRNRKLDLCSLRFADPVPLHRDDPFGPPAFQQLQVIE